MAYELKDNEFMITGRIVQGHPLTPYTTDQQGKPLMDQHGQPKVKYFMAVAVPKSDPTLAGSMQKLITVAMAGFPRLFNSQGQCLLPTFSAKWVDGDSTTPDQSLTAPCQKKGFPGNVVFKLSSGYAPQCARSEGGVYNAITEAQVKTGDYVRVLVSMVPNGQVQKPGLYLNMQKVEIIGYGEEIVSGPAMADVFAQPAVLPAGASATPLGGGAAPSAGAPYGTLGQTPSTGYAPTASTPTAPFPAPAIPVYPARDFLNPIGTGGPIAPSAAPAAPPPAPALVKRRASDGSVWTEDQLRAAKWTEAQIAAAPVV
jgi:hypothetical protein